MDDFWVFGYGSLMWRPGFAHEETRQARLFGYHRALCVRSFVHRGTPERPGLVLGLDRGGSCHGVAFRVRPADRDTVTEYLRARELVTNVYLETTRKVRLDDGRDVRALTYVVDRGHTQYGGALSVRDALSQVSRRRRAVGSERGLRDQYGRASQDIAGIRDHHLEAVADARSGFAAPRGSMKPVIEA
jgi:cation transport protein ChaC